jgi:hypothetical protein
LEEQHKYLSIASGNSAWRAVALRTFTEHATACLANGHIALQKICVNEKTEIWISWISSQPDHPPSV